MKDATVARLAVAVAKHYEAAHEHATSAGVFPDDWTPSIQMKAYYMNAVANEKKAKVTLEEGKYGEEVGRLHLANSLIQKTLEPSLQRKAIPSVAAEAKSFQTSLKDKLVRAERDNDSICKDNS
jgi:programmed cell death 6-interacting protein